jgi:hypothetical protein
MVLPKYRSEYSLERPWCRMKRRKRPGPPSRAFEVRINYKDSESAAFCFEHMCAKMIDKGHGEFEQVRRRGFQMTLRPADVATEDFIDRKIAASDLMAPVFCLPEPGAYVYFGRFKPKPPKKAPVKGPKKRW